MIDCGCRERHEARRIVLTGGPGAGKTAVLALVKQSLCQHLRVLPEAAGILFGGGFPRSDGLDARRAAQRAILRGELPACCRRHLALPEAASTAG